MVSFSEALNFITWNESLRLQRKQTLLAVCFFLFQFFLCSSVCMWEKKGICKAEILSCNLTNDRQEEVKLYEVGRAKILFFFSFVVKEWVFVSLWQECNWKMRNLRDLSAFLMEANCVCGSLEMIWKLGLAWRVGG